MECDICSRSSQDNIDFWCIACARNSIYLPRLEHAQALLEKDILSKQVETVVKSDISHLPISDKQAPLPIDRKVWDVELAYISVNEVKKELERVKDNQEQARNEIDNVVEQIRQVRVKIAARKQNLRTIHNDFPARRESHVSDFMNKTITIRSSLFKIQQRSTDARAKLCREAATLMGLRQQRRQRDTPLRNQISIAGLTLPDLREISNLRCTDLTSVLGSVAHLTLRVAFYLGVRLPAEIKEPHADYPQYTIFTPAGSYKGIIAESVTSQPSLSADVNSSTSQQESSATLKARPLSIGKDHRDDRVLAVQQRDEQAFRYFVEGITLLAWDVAWLCRVQGFTAGTETWENICNMGRNLHQLILANPPTPTISRMQSDKLLSRRASQTRKSSTPLGNDSTGLNGRLGQNSDLAALSSENRIFIRDLLSSWEYASWHKIAIHLRKMLLAEIASAEWELLQDDEWDDGGEQFNEAVVVKPRLLDGRQYDDARSINPHIPRSEDETSKIPSGWTKLKSREKPA